MTTTNLLLHCLSVLFTSPGIFLHPSRDRRGEGSYRDSSLVVKG